MKWSIIFDFLQQLQLVITKLNTQISTHRHTYSHEIIHACHLKKGNTVYKIIWNRHNTLVIQFLWHANVRNIMKSTNERKKYITDYSIFKTTKTTREKRPYKAPWKHDWHASNQFFPQRYGRWWQAAHILLYAHLNHGTYIHKFTSSGSDIIQHQVKRIIIAK